jgi:hypothetical protein
VSLRIDRAKALIIEAMSANPIPTRAQIVRYVQTNWASPKWKPEEIEAYGSPYGRTEIYEIINDLIEHDRISEPRHPRK